MKKIINIIIKENPTFVLLLGLCPALAVTTKVENALLMGVCVLLILLFTNIIVSIIKKLIPKNVKIPVFVLIIGTFVTVVEILLKDYLPDLHKALGVYLPLIVVNCIVLGRALSVASKSNIKTSALDALGIGIGFTFSITIIALVREVLGNNSITLMESLTPITGYSAVYKDVLPFSIPVFSSPAGAFLTLGLLIALFNKGGKYESN